MGVVQSQLSASGDDPRVAAGFGDASGRSSASSASPNTSSLMIRSVASFKYSSSAREISRYSGQQGLGDKRFGCSHNDRRISLTRITIRTESVTAAKREKQPATPAVGQAEIHFHRALQLGSGIQCCAYTAERCGSRVTFSCRRRSFKEGRNLAQLFTKFAFSGQR